MSRCCQELKMAEGKRGGRGRKQEDMNGGDWLVSVSKYQLC